jgi:hypothetical protein
LFQNDTQPSIYSITSPAVASSFNGMSMPSRRAVLRLMMSSNFVGAQLEY